MRMDKFHLREEMQIKRKYLDMEERRKMDHSIAEIVIHSPVFIDCDYICVYRAFRGEISCNRIIKTAWAYHKLVYVPVTDLRSHTIEFYKITPKTKWREGAYGIKEPAFRDGEKEALSEPALVLTPGLAFDREHHRIGYGGGYYDRYLAAHTEHTTMALAYNFQIVDERIPVEEHDMTVDYLVTELGMY